MKPEQVSDVHQHSQTAPRRMKPFVRLKKHSLVEDSLTQFLKRLMSLSKNVLKKVCLILKKNGNVISMTRDTYLREESYAPFYPPSEKSKGKETEPVLAEIWDTFGKPS